MNEFDVVVALKDLHEGKVPAGSEGTVLDVFSSPIGYRVEFDDIENDDVFIVICHPGDIEVKRSEPFRKTA